VNDDERVEDLLRPLAPQVLGSLVRRYGTFDECEDAVQEALLAAAEQWPVEGVPAHPRGWLVTVADRRLTDELRRRGARRRREEADAVAMAVLRPWAPDPAAADDAGEHDDSLQLLFLCCHPALTPASQVALTLRAVGGLTTTEIATAFLVPDSTMAQRISRAKQRIKESGAALAMPPPAERAARLRSVLHVLYLVFNEGYAATSGEALARDDLTADAIRLTRQLHARLPDEPEVTGLLALMLLNEARRATRTDATGALVPLDGQDRSRWDRTLIAEGVAHLGAALPTGRIGPYQLQAAIAAVHDEAPSTDETDWVQILGLYDLLDRIAPNPMVSLNRAVAVAMVRGPAPGLALLDELATDGRLVDHHRLAAARAHLLERLGDLEAARAEYRRAARLTTSRPEQRHLDARARRLFDPGVSGPPRHRPAPTP
jgi:RNA polymerase sigma factor (sigma-70 family)